MSKVVTIELENLENKIKVLDEDIQKVNDRIVELERDKVKTIATRLYRAEDIIADKKIRDQITMLQNSGYGHFPVCIAKSQYSFSTDPNLKGAPNNHVMAIREVRLSAGAGFIVVVCGDIMTMPGLPRVPAANNIDIGDNGEIVGLF